MDDDEVWAAVDERRLQVVDLLEGLSEPEWRQPSLCAGWTVRDVAAHLNLQQVGVLAGLGMFARSPGGMNHVIQAAARRRASRPTDLLIEGIRTMVGSRRHNVGLDCRATLIDILVHGADIAVALGRDLPMAVDAAAEAAGRVWSVGWPFRARRRFAGFRIAATDVDWAVGTGPLVQAPIESLLLALTGRDAVLPTLTGPAADQLRSALGPTPGRPRRREQMR